MPRARSPADAWRSSGLRSHRRCSSQRLEEARANFVPDFLRQEGFQSLNRPWCAVVFGDVLLRFFQVVVAVDCHYLEHVALDLGDPAADIDADATPIIFGDFKRGYRVYDRLSLDIMADPYSVRVNGLARYHARRRVGAGVTRPTAFKKLVMAV